MGKGMIKNKRGQNTMSLPFGVIFSIILIVVFIIVAVYAVIHFLDVGECAQVGQFYSDFQKKVDDAWTSQSSSFELEIDLPSGTERVCFANISGTISDKETYDEFGSHIPEHNLFILPDGKSCNMPSKEILHLDIARITSTRNPYCIDVSRPLKISKDFYDKLVRIS